MTAKQSADSLQCLQLFYNDTTANFHSCEQGYAIVSVLYTMSNVLAILPTGSGKSILFFLYAKNYRSLTSIVVVPTFSLQQDLLQRAACHGTASSDQLGNITGQNVVFVTPVAVIRDGFRDKIIFLYGSGSHIATIHISHIGKICPPFIVMLGYVFVFLAIATTHR